MATVSKGRRKRLVTVHLPDIAASIRSALQRLAQSRSDGVGATDLEALIAGLENLEIVSRCNCGDDFCASFHTGVGGPAEGNFTIEIPEAEGVVAVDIMEGRIHHVEILYRPDVKATLDELFS